MWQVVLCVSGLRRFSEGVLHVREVQWGGGDFEMGEFRRENFAITKVAKIPAGKFSRHVLNIFTACSYGHRCPAIYPSTVCATATGRCSLELCLSERAFRAHQAITASFRIPGGGEKLSLSKLSLATPPPPCTGRNFLLWYILRFKFMQNFPHNFQAAKCAK